MSRGFRPIVLCYHAFSASWIHPLSVAPPRFERQVRSLLARGYRPIGLQEAADGLRGVHVTFDDAYRSVARALPTVRRLGILATVFVCPEYADDGRPFAVPELADEAERHPDELRTLTWSDLRALDAEGIEIGSHTLTHPHLPVLGDAELDRELRDSRRHCEDELRRPCRFLSYPYGEHDLRVRRAAARAGYDAAFALARGPRMPSFEPYAVPRIDLYRRDNLLLTTVKTSFLHGPGFAVLRAAGLRPPAA